jgi:ribonucrease Y
MMHPIITVAIAIVMAGLGLMFGFRMAMRGASSHYSARVREAEELLAKANSEVETSMHEARLEAAEMKQMELEKLDEVKHQQQSQLRSKEAELREQRMSLEKKQQTVSSKELDLKHKDRVINKTREKLEQRQQQVEVVIEKQNQRLEKIAQMTGEEAREHLFQNLEHSVQMESAKYFNEIREKSRMYATQEARQILINAMERTSIDHSAQSTVTMVELPSDEIKGRIIGREGRNIRSFESVTGVELLVDDTPNCVILSSFNPMRREIARISLESLINDGRIHPARIEEVVEKIREEFDVTLMELGEQAMLDIGVHGLHKELIRLLGVLSFKNMQGQNMLAHSQEVASIAGIIAAQLHLDAKLIRRIGLLHDIGMAVDGYADQDVRDLGADMVRKFGERQEVVDAVRLVGSSELHNSVEATLVEIANNISIARPGIRGEQMGMYLERLEQLEKIASSFNGVDSAYVLQAGRELRVLVANSEISDDQLDVLASEIAESIQREVVYPGQVRVTVTREFRCLELAK